MFSSIEVVEFEAFVSHYYEKDVGPLLSICDLDAGERREIIRRERGAKTGFNRFSHGEEFFDFRLLADDLLIALYEDKFGRQAPRRPFYGVLGQADVVGGLFRDPYRISIPMEHFAEHEVTFMCPDHFHLVGLSEEHSDRKMFGFQPPKDYSESRYPYFGQLLSYQELLERYHDFHIDRFLTEQRESNGWYRYVEAQIWADPQVLREKYGEEASEVWPEPWTHAGVTYLQNYKDVR